MSMDRQANWIAAAQQGSDLRVWPMRDRTALTCLTTQHRQTGLAEDLQALTSDWLGEARIPVLLAGDPGAIPVAVPAKPLDLPPQPGDSANRLTIHVLPGLCQKSPPALMYSAATRIAGFLALNPDWDGVLCTPGARTHWVQISAGEVVSFQSFLTGSCFDALSRLPLLGLHAEQTWDQPALAEAVEDAMAKPERLAARIAELHAGMALLGLSANTARSRLIGALIGAELATAKPYWLGQNLALLGQDARGVAYATALEQLGAPVTVADAQRMMLEGLYQGWRRLSGSA